MSRIPAHPMGMRVASRWLSAKDWETQNALDAYLKEHPNADKSKHKVKELGEQPKGEGEEEPEEKPKGVGEEEPEVKPKGEGEEEPEEKPPAEEGKDTKPVKVPKEDHPSEEEVGFVGKVDDPEQAKNPVQKVVNQVEQGKSPSQKDVANSLMLVIRGLTKKELKPEEIKQLNSLEKKLRSWAGVPGEDEEVDAKAKAREDRDLESLTLDSPSGPSRRPKDKKDKDKGKGKPKEAPKAPKAPKVPKAPVFDFQAPKKEAPKKEEPEAPKKEPEKAPKPSEDKPPKKPGKPKGKKPTPPEKSKYHKDVQGVMDKHKLKEDDAESLRSFRKDKPPAGKKLTDQQLMQKFMAKAKPETKERMKGMPLKDFMVMYKSILEEEEGMGKVGSLRTRTIRAAYLNPVYRSLLLAALSEEDDG